MLDYIKRKFPEKLQFPTAARKCDLTIIFAAANGEWRGVRDLIDSLKTYLDCDYEIIAVDDMTDDGTHAGLLESGCWVVRNPQREYLWGLDRTLRRGFNEALRLFDSPIYLKIDPDALLIKNGLEHALKAAFNANQHVGLLGAYHFGHDGGQRDLSYWRERMLRQEHSLGLPFKLARQNGYSPGDGVQGGVYALSRNCLARIVRSGWLAGKGGYNPPRLRPARIAEDSLIAMLTFAAGFKVGEFGGPGQPFATKDKGLPKSPEELLNAECMVVHSVKYEDEASVHARALFRTARENFKAARHAR